MRNEMTKLLQKALTLNTCLLWRYTDWKMPMWKIYIIRNMASLFALPKTSLNTFAFQFIKSRLLMFKLNIKKTKIGKYQWVHQSKRINTSLRGSLKLKCLSLFTGSNEVVWNWIFNTVLLFLPYISPQNTAHNTTKRRNVF